MVSTNKENMNNHAVAMGHILSYVNIQLKHNIVIALNNKHIYNKATNQKFLWDRNIQPGKVRGWGR